MNLIVKESSSISFSLQKKCQWAERGLNMRMLCPCPGFQDLRENKHTSVMGLIILVMHTTALDVDSDRTFTCSLNVPSLKC